MVKGISRQVIVVHSPDQNLFDQAIFILKDEAFRKQGVTDEMLLKEADKILHSSQKNKKRRLKNYGAVWACAGALTTGLVWLVTSLI